MSSRDGVSPDTLLRLLHALTDRALPAPRVLGVDDVALRRGRGRRRYGTLLVDLETHRPVDLLDDRTAETLATWLREHPGVEIIVRDRAGAYAEGARQGAPQATQVADRFHLSANASAAMDELLRGRRRRVEFVQAAPDPDPDLPPSVTPSLPPPPLSRAKQQEIEARARRVARWETVVARHRAGESINHIARELGMGRMTVRRYLRTSSPPRNRVPARPRPGGLTSPMLEPYRAYLESRWRDGCANIAQLCRELEALGYHGSLSLLYRALVPWRGPRPPPDPSGRRRRGRRRVKRYHLRWLCLRPPEQLDADEREALEVALAEDEALALGYSLLQRFRRLVRRGGVRDLDEWLEDAADSGLAPFMSLARGIEADRAAANAGLTLPWSTGPVEGHVTRVKLLKRQGYGRACTSLLRRRVLDAA